MTPERRRIWGWMLFDVAQQPYATLGLTFVFGPYFADVAARAFAEGGLGAEAAGARAQSTWAWAQAGAGLLVALTAPILGALADRSGARTPWILGFSAIFLPCAAAMWFLHPDGTNLHIAPSAAMATTIRTWRWLQVKGTLVVSLVRRRRPCRAGRRQPALGGACSCCTWICAARRLSRWARK